MLNITIYPVLVSKHEKKIIDSCIDLWDSIFEINIIT